MTKKSDVARTTPKLRFELFGGLRVLEDGRPLEAARIHDWIWLVVVLGLQEGAPASKRFLCNLLYKDESLSADEFGRLRQCIRKARTALGGESTIRLVGDAYALDTDAAAFDFLEFFDLAREGLEHSDQTILTRAASLFENGELLFGYEMPSRVENPRLAKLRLRLEERHRQVQSRLQELETSKHAVRPGHSGTEPDTKVGATVAHVVMTDRVGSTALGMERKALLDEELRQAVESCPAVKRTPASDLVLGDGGDGIFLAFFGDPTAAAEAAIFLHDTINASSEASLRIGINSGPVVRRLDVTGRTNVSGQGIDKAQRVMACGSGNDVLVSEFFAENLRAFDSWRDRLELLGPRKVKHGDEVILYRLLASSQPLTHAAMKVKDDGSPKRVSVLFKKGAEQDEHLLAIIQQGLAKDGHEVFVDRQPFSIQWAIEIERQLRSSDSVVVLVSQQGSTSELLNYELQAALDEHERRGRPMVFVVTMGTFQPPRDLASLLGRAFRLDWTNSADDNSVVDRLVAVIREPDKALAVPLEQPGGAVPLESRLYIERETDERFLNAIALEDTIVLVRGGRQMGKTSLLARGLDKVRSQGATTLFTDFQSFNTAEMETDVGLYRALMMDIIDQLDLDINPAETWNDWLGPNKNLEKFVEKVVLDRCPAKVVWGMDEVDRLFGRPYAGDFFGMIRSWHNRRSLRPGTAWDRLIVAMAYATEAHLFITDLNQSPFNVGTRLSLDDFSLAQFSELNRLHSTPLQAQGDLERAYALLGGQPYLSHRLLDEIVRNGRTLPELEDLAQKDEGPFGDHLRRVLIGLAQDTSLQQAVQVVLGGGAPDRDAFFRLRSAGILVGASAEEARLRCRLYETFLRKHLSAN